MVSSLISVLFWIALAQSSQRGENISKREEAHFLPDFNETAFCCLSINNGIFLKKKIVGNIYIYMCVYIDVFIYIYIYTYIT